MLDPRAERFQRLVFYPATVFYTRLRRWHGEKNLVRSSPPSHDCRCTNAILRKHVCSLSSFDGSDTAMRCGSFYTIHSFTGRWWCVEEALHPISAGSRCPSFCRLTEVLASHDIAINLRSSRQRTLPQTTAPLLIRGATVRRRPLNKLPKPCPLWTRAPVK